MSLASYFEAHPLQPQDSQSSIVTTTTDNLEASRPRTPESPLTSSLQDATATIDDLTSAMAQFSKMPNTPLPDNPDCCCGKDECTNHQTWIEFKAKLESRLILCAEVGQALLQRHEAYVRRHPRTDEDKTRLESEVDELRSHNASLEKRLARALVNSEVSEASNKVVLQELQDTRSNLSRLTTQHAKCVGLESRLTRVTTEKEDLQQERDSVKQRARVAESRIVSLRDRVSRLQEQVTTLHTELDQKRNHRLELSEEISQGARLQLETWLRSNAEPDTPITPNGEMTKILETLVADNEMLKREGEELQRLLSESREDFRALQEELDELRASENRKYSRHHSHSAKSSMQLPPLSLAPLSPRSTRSLSGGGFTRLSKRASSAERNQSIHEPFTPVSDRDSDSPDPWGRTTQLDGLVTPSRLLLELDGETVAAAPANKRPLLLLTRSRGVQTDLHSHSKSPLAPSPLSTHDNYLSADGGSESSSTTGSVPSVLSSVLERASSLLHRLTLSDAPTLANRLKRQHLAGDVSHLSRTTVSSIVSEAILLRSNFRSLLEDDKIVTACTRKDLRALFNFIKDAFNELGELRVTLNDILLDPSLAPKISEAMMNPSKGLAEKEAGGGAAGWIAPIVKLFQGGDEKSTSSSTLHAPTHGLLKSNSRGSTSTTQKPIPRVVPKLSPALSASTTTVNVEFQSGSAGRAITSTHSAHPSSGAGDDGVQQASDEEIRAKTSASVMGIFAGAPQPPSPLDPWIVIPKPSRKPPSPLSQLAGLGFESGDARSAPGSGTLTIGRNTLKVNSQLSRVVDAVVDVQSPTLATTPSDYQATLAYRGLRSRGLSDSSIHTTFLNHTDDQQDSSGERQFAGDEESGQEPASSGILGSFGKTLRSVSSSFGPLSRGATPKPPVPKLSVIPPSRSGTANPSTVSNPPATSRMRSPLSQASKAQVESDDDDLGGPAISRGAFFPIAGARTNVGIWPGNEPYVGSITQDWMTARENGPGARDY